MGDKNGFTEIVSWQPHGRCFLVHKTKEFVDIVLPKYFKQTKLTSFQRQLNLYGFCRLTRGRDAGAYYHEMFLRGKGFLCQSMTRTKIKGTGTKGASNPDSEPNFYDMPFVDENEVAKKKDEYSLTGKVQSQSGVLPEDERSKGKEPIKIVSMSPSESTSVISQTQKINPLTTSKAHQESVRETLWNRPFYYMDEIKLPFSRNTFSDDKGDNVDLFQNNEQRSCSSSYSQEAFAQDLLDITSLPIPLELFEDDASLNLADDLSLGLILNKIVSSKIG